MVKRVLILIFLILLFGVGCKNREIKRDTLFQTSTINALIEGIYDGDVTIGELKKNGDTGLGTFNGLDGEMVAVEGVFYQIKADGLASVSGSNRKTPFAAVTFFEADSTINVTEVMDYEMLKTYIDRKMTAKNIIYTIKINGLFSYIKTRSVPKQSKPYPRLIEVVKDQPLFQFHNIEGTIVGFRLPDYIEGINVPGYHLHFITKDRNAGGHLLELETENVTIEMDSTTEMYLTLLKNTEFNEFDFTKNRTKEIETIER